MIVHRDDVWDLLSPRHVEQRCGLGDGDGAVEFRIERDLVVEDLARTWHLAVVESQDDVINRARATRLDRRRGRNVGGLYLAELWRAGDRIVETAQAGRHGERSGIRRNDLRIARNVIRSWRGHGDLIFAAARTCRIAEVNIELIESIRERDLALLCRIIEATRRKW